MVIASQSYEEQTRRLLSEAQSELTTIGRQIHELEEKYQTLKKETDAYETALQGFLRRSGKQQDTGKDWKTLISWALTHKDRIRLIAENNGGTVKASQATDILYTNGFIKSKKRANAYQIVQNNLIDMVDVHIFEKIKPGEYRLIKGQPSLISETPIKE